MDAEQARTFLLKLPHVAETQQWGDNLVYWVGDRTAGGKMFCLLNLDVGSGPVGHGVISYAAGRERYAELLEHEGLRPAPYLARASWVAAERWDVWRPREWQDELQRAHQVIYAKLPARVRQALEGKPPTEKPAKSKAAAKIGSR